MIHMDIKAVLVDVVAISATAAAVIKIMLLEYESVRRAWEHVHRNHRQVKQRHRADYSQQTGMWL